MFEKFKFEKKSLSPSGLNKGSVSSGPRIILSGQDPSVTPKVPLEGREKAEDKIYQCEKSECIDPVKQAALDARTDSRSPPEQSNGNAEQRKKKRRKSCELKPEVFDEFAEGLPERLGDKPLRAIIVGTNPSGHAWRSGHYYSNPNNNMWKILKQTGIAPASISGAQDDYKMPDEAGVGFLDVGCGVPGTHLSKFSSETMQGWGSGFFIRLAAHMQRASQSIGCVCGKCGAPRFVCFAGKRQWMELLNTGKKGREKLTKLEQGKQSLRPNGWPFPSVTQVWVLPSTSGAAPMTVEERFGPYRELAQMLSNVPWPLEHGECEKNKL